MGLFKYMLFVWKINRHEKKKPFGKRKLLFEVAIINVDFLDIIVNIASLDSSGYNLVEAPIFNESEMVLPWYNFLSYEILR